MSSPIVQKVWSFCNTLSDDGVGYRDYLEQLTYLLFLKMADEYTKPTNNRKMPNIKEFSRETLTIKGQQHIVDELESKLSVYDKIDEAITNSLQQAEMLKQNILKNVLEGKLVDYNTKLKTT